MSLRVPGVDVAARQAVLQQIAKAIERFAVRERQYRAEGDLPMAEGAHRYVEWLSRAYKAEFRSQRRP